MDKVDDTSKLPPARTQIPSRVAAETRSRLEKAIEAQREHLLQAHGVLTCLYEVPLYAEGDDAICYAQAAHAAASLNQQVRRGTGQRADQADDRCSEPQR